MEISQHTSFNNRESKERQRDRTGTEDKRITNDILSPNKEVEKIIGDVSEDELYKLSI